MTAVNSGVVIAAGTAGSSCDGKLLLDRQVLIPKIVIRQTLSEAIAGGWLFQAQGEMTAGPLGILLDVLRPCIVKRKTR